MSVEKTQGKSSGFGRGEKIRARGVSRKPRLSNPSSGQGPEERTPMTTGSGVPHTHQPGGPWEEQASTGSQVRPWAPLTPGTPVRHEVPRRVGF